MDRRLSSADQRADILVAQMTLDEGCRRCTPSPTAPTPRGKSFAHCDTVANVWSTVDGTYRVRVGTSSADLPLTVPVRVVGGHLR
jgi:hypothetical protein